MSHTAVENTIPVLTVNDLERSIEFFHRVLGFQVEWNAGTICAVSRDGSSIMLQVQDNPNPGTVWIGLDGTTLIESVARSGVEVLQAPSNKPWAYETKVADPEGNTIWLGAEPKPE